MPGINLKIDGNAQAMKVSDACTTNSGECANTWHKLFQATIQELEILPNLKGIPVG